MKNFYMLLMVSIIGLTITLGGVYLNDKSNHGDTQPIPKMQLPFTSFIAGTGIIESASKNIVIGSLVSGIIKTVYVKNGQEVKKGALLFSLDESALLNKIALVQTQKSILFAKIKATKEQFELIKEFKHLSSQMVTSEKFKSKKNAYKIAKASLQVLDKKLKILTQTKEFYKIYSPIDGIVLSSELTVGSYFDKSDSQNLLRLGSNKLNINVSINEYDIWKFQKNTPAIAFVRGHPELKIKCKYLYTTPFVTPKIALTGSSTEQTDTRVLHIIYDLDNNISFPLFVGQQLDVFVKTDK